MAQSPEELRREIEQTREDLSRDVDAINDKVSPGRIVQRRVDRTKSAVGSVRERVMGTASAGTGKITDKANSAQSSLSSAQSSISDAVTGAPDAALSRTQGNPLAVGLLVFASGWLISSLIPVSKAEEQAMMTIEDKVKEPVKEQLGSIASEVKDDLQGSAQDAVQSVKETATQAAQTVSEQGKDSAQTVKSDAQGAAQEVRSSSGGSSSSGSI